MDHGVAPDLILVGYCFNEREGWPGDHYTPEQKARIIRGVSFKNLLRSSGLYNFTTEKLLGKFYYTLRNKLIPQVKLDNPKARGADDRWIEHYSSIHKTYNIGIDN